MEMEEINIVIIDHHYFTKEGLHYLLNKEANCHVLASSDTLQSVSSILTDQQVHLLLIDRKDYLEQLREINALMKENKLETKILVLYTEPDDEIILGPIAVNLNGYMHKSMSVKQMMQVIELVVVNDLYVRPKEMKEHLPLTKNRLKSESSHEDSRPRHVYTKREWEIIELLVRGYRNMEIASYLNISDKTVKNHMSNIFKKMQVNDRVKVVLHAIQEGWVEI